MKKTAPRKLVLELQLQSHALLESIIRQHWTHLRLSSRIFICTSKFGQITCGGGLVLSLTHVASHEDHLSLRTLTGVLVINSSAWSSIVWKSRAAGAGNARDFASLWACDIVYVNTQHTLRARDSSLLRIQSLLYRPPGLPGKDYFRTTVFFPANFVTLCRDLIEWWGIISRGNVYTKQH